MGDSMPEYVDPDGNPIDLDAWVQVFAKLREGDHYVWRRQTTVGGVRVSTVWLGINHAWGLGETPLFWETMIFGGAHDQDQWRYPSKEEAFAGHDRIVAALREGRAP